MARIRTIKPEFWTSEQVVACSLNTRLLFIGLWNFCDDAGRIEDAARQIKMKIFPGDDFTSADIDEMLTELSVNGLLLRYAVDGKGYIEVTGWHHQKINRPNPSKIPGPCVNAHGNLTEPHLPEGKGKERKIESPPTPSLPLTEPSRKAEEDGGKDDRIDEIRKAVWRQHGLTEDRIATNLAAASAEGIHQARSWLQAGLSLTEILAAVARGYDEAKEPIRRPWVYLDHVMRTTIEDKSKPAPTEFIDQATEQWRARIKAWRDRKAWLPLFGVRPDDPDFLRETSCPRKVLAEFGLLEGATP